MFTLLLLLLLKIIWLRYHNYLHGFRKLYGLNSPVIAKKMSGVQVKSVKSVLLQEEWDIKLLHNDAICRSHSSVEAQMQYELYPWELNINAAKLY